MKKFFLTGAAFSLLMATGCTTVVQPPAQTPSVQTTPVVTPPAATPTTTILKIMAPQNPEQYRTQMTKFAQEGGLDPLKTTVFVQKEFTVPYTPDVMRMSAQAAATNMYQAGRGPAAIAVSYFKVQNKTAYVLLNADIDGWAGVSTTLAILHPVVEKTLLQFSEITKVVWNVAPGDKKEDVVVE